MMDTGRISIVTPIISMEKEASKRRSGHRELCLHLKCSSSSFMEKIYRGVD